MKRLEQSGQTIIALLIFMMVAMTVTIAAIGIAVINEQSNNSYFSGEMALQNAQSGIETALIALERNPTYTGETITLADGTATITVSGSSTFNIVSVGSSGNYQRTLTATATDTANVLNLTSWNETP